MNIQEGRDRQGVRYGAVDVDSEAQTAADAAARLSRQRFEVTPPAALSTAGTEPVRCKQAAAELRPALPLPASDQLKWHARRSSVQHAGSWLACHSCNPTAIHKCCHLDLAKGLRCAAGHVCVLDAATTHSTAARCTRRRNTSALAQTPAHTCDTPLKHWLLALSLRWCKVELLELLLHLCGCSQVASARHLRAQSRRRAGSLEGSRRPGGRPTCLPCI